MAVRTLRRTVSAVGAIALLTGLAATQAGAEADEDPRIQQYRDALAQLRPLTDPPACDQVPEPDRWTDAGTPDQGSADAVISAHRGALTLAPENTLDSYAYAFAYGVDLVEVDIQQTKDGRFVALHDSTVDRTTDGTGNISDLTFDEVRALNAADYAPWSGTAYDPAQVASLEEVLELAQEAGKGVELDIKGSVTEEGELAEIVGDYGLIEESIFNSSDPRVFQAEPAARLIFNRDDWEPAFLIYEIAEVFKVFGSRLDEYTPESIAAAHDACAIVMPHAYDAGPEQEVAQFLQARAMGADGVQTNQPELIVAAAGEAVNSAIETVRGEHGRVDEICLVNADNGFGFPGKPVRFERGAKSAELTTGRGGCVVTPEGHWQGARVTFPGDGAVHASAARLVP